MLAALMRAIGNLEREFEVATAAGFRISHLRVDDLGVVLACRQRRQIDERLDSAASKSINFGMSIDPFVFRHP